MSGTLGNTLVLIAFKTKFQKLKSQEMFFINLAIADLIGSIILPAYFYLKLIKQDMIGIGVAGCQLLEFLEVVNIMVSAWTLVVISFDRLVVIRWPFWRRSHDLRFQSILLCIGTWLISSAYGFKYVFYDRIILEFDGCYHVCKHCNYIETGSMELKLVLKEVLPFILITAAHAYSVAEIRKQARNPLIQIPESEERKRQKSNVGAMKLSLVIVGVFHVCNLPLYVYEIYHEFIHDEGTQQHFIDENRRITIFLNCLVMVCNCSNPFIYSRLHRKFRMWFRMICCAPLRTCVNSTFQKLMRKRFETLLRKRYNSNTGMRAPLFQTSRTISTIAETNV